MQPTTSGTFRVLSRPDGGELLLADRADPEDLTAVATRGYEGDLAERVRALRPGYVVEATVEWADGDARFVDVAVEKRTLVAYAEGVTGLFEAALDTIEEAKREGLGVNSRPTFSTDGEPNGAVYAFAEQRGERDVFEEIRSGALPLEPLLDRLNDREDCDHEVFVFRPLDHQFVVVYLVLHKGSVLADTVRDTYDCPRPAEPLAAD